ncbi:methionine--tRNA ligase [Candidatus Parcubacteria bacterium]|jgi:methionyl-tRNA synthetase|nr:methionine--tRNA ligase [Candidatus Parcubacteria bacterium]
MDKLDKFYITTPIYYVNDKPHIGHAYTTILADVLARFYRSQIGDENVYFLTGTDEHGAKVAESAEKQGISPQEFTDQVSKEFSDAWKNLDISNDHFIRTTDKKHQQAVVKILEKLKEKGAIYEGDYNGLYCVGCEKFITNSELVDGKCPDHNKKPQELTEKNWFFKLGDFLPKIKKAIESGELMIYPETRKNEVLGLIDKQELPDFSISRSKDAVNWGIDLPWDDSQKVYVWIDALCNYITALDYPDGKDFKKFWPADAHFLALEILKFHAVYWPAILMALDIPLPKLNIHGFFTLDGKKMSKTLGNVISPNDLVDKYGPEVTKYLILSQFSFGSESDIKVEHFTEKYNADLVNGLGNLVNRVTNMIEQYLDGKIDSDQFNKQIVGGEEIKNLRFREALLTIWQLIQKGNALIDEKKPWQLAKDEANKEELNKLLQELASDLHVVALSLKPFMPSKAEELIKILTAKKVIKPEQPLFPRLSE